MSEFQELNKKSIRTKEEDERLEELTASIQDLDESFAGLTGDDLAGAVMGKISDNTTQINNLANKNLELAYDIKDLNNSTIGQQAVANSLIASQEKLIERLINSYYVTQASDKQKAKNSTDEDF